MTKLFPLSEVARRHPGFTPGWKAAADMPAQNPKFGFIQHAVVCDDSGAPAYDTPLWVERTGAACAAEDERGRLAMLNVWRPALAPPEEPGQAPLADYSRLGRWSLETPRGYADPGESPRDAALRETEEETGCAALEAISLGPTNCNTALFPNSIHLFLVRIDSQRRPARAADPVERIGDVAFLSWNEVMARVADGAIWCGITRSVLLGLLAYRQRSAGEW